MKIFKNINIPPKYKNSAIAIGNFDGIHYGHQRVFHKAKNFAKKNKIKFGILTFTPIPVMFFNKKIKNHRLVSENQKLVLLKKHGVNFIINIKFNKNFSTFFEDLGALDNKTNLLFNLFKFSKTSIAPG